MTENIDVNKIVVSNKVSFGKKGFKYFIGQKIDFYANSSQKMSAYKTEFDKNKCMCLLIKDEKLLEKFNKIWNKVNNII